MHSKESALQQENPTVPTDMSNWKRTAIAIVITAILTGTVGHILGVHTTSSISQNTEKTVHQPSATLTPASLTSTPDLTANWKTYTSMTKDRPRFTLKYLPTWTYFEWKDSPYFSGKRYDTKRIDFGDPSEKTDLGYLYPIIRLSLTKCSDFDNLSAEEIKNQELQYDT